MVETSLVTADDSLLQDAYARNLRYLYGNRTEAERAKSGYLTALYNLEILRKIVLYEDVIIATVAGKAVGHYYPLPDYFRSQVPELRPKLDVYDQISYENRPVSTFRFFEIMQILVEGGNQRIGIARKLVEHAIQRTRGVYELLFVKIAEGNDRSLKFHTAMSFRPIALVTTGEIKLHILVIDLRPLSKL